MFRLFGGGLCFGGAKKIHKRLYSNESYFTICGKLKNHYLQSFTVLFDFSISLTGTPKVDILVAELFLQKLGERVETGWVGQQLVKVGRPSANPANVLLSSICLYQKTFSHRHKDRKWMTTT